MLRPEGTAGIMRSLLEHKQLEDNKEHKVFYMGEMFRYERPQHNRLRQFHQLGCEVLQEDNPYADLQTILVGYQILQAVQPTGQFQVLINNIGSI